MNEPYQNMQENSEEPSTKEALFNTITGPAKWWISGLVGISTGLAKLVTDVRTKFYDNVLHGPDFKSILEAHGKELGRIKNDRRAGITSTHEFIKQFHAQKDAFADKTEAFAEELGIHSTGFRGLTEGTVQRFQTLSQNARAPLVFSSIATTVIGFAGTSMFLNSLAQRKQLKDIAKHPVAGDDMSRS